MAQHGATLNGIINPNGADTTGRFEYGLDSTYGTQVELTPIPLGTADVPVSADITDLLPNTPYHFRLVAENESGQTLGGDMIFTTLPDPIVVGVPVVTTLDATNIS